MEPLNCSRYYSSKQSIQLSINWGACFSSRFKCPAFCPELIGSLTVLLINNQEGIFENLSVADLPEFEKCFATPQSVTLPNFVRSFGGIPSNSGRKLISHIKSPPTEGIRVIEIRTDRKADRKVRQNLLSLGT